jgi:protein phosphatase
MEDRLFIVCDGMGGYEKGEVASQTVCQVLGKWFQDNAIPETPFVDELLHLALETAYQELDRYDNGSVMNLGTTLTLLYIHRHGITAAHIGDSRIYHIRPTKSFQSNDDNRKLRYISRDHSLVFDLFQSGEITYEEMLNHPKKNVITRAMQPGEDNRMPPDIIHISDIQRGDYFYLCSDGMLENMGNGELVEIFSSKTSDEEKRQRLIEATKDNHDNHSAWLIHIKDVIREDTDKALDNEEETARCNQLNILNKT